ncbi:acetyltransferase [Myxococcus llanfairpwllgwyngyllgogerychwyrndrobwllllantysiliogogogochensis]|uniref:Acetyltransferase n=1 Tax=Myxococcus llanfairpwllgwyngyllgogerychwyrndrobwllllantysiliogogogochensis TaxID=2590453 RepID=A0A540WKS3_9BACT|nr:acetyltransferase [Myxococcus llanfairpwllgwyngyllgogerychwyrndrobwllllantysiliogogogochensis]TQF09417.1 acetyltransferase [Myxococcus llanfairpwllgwyngyllgogerychwyrndrobwllllantysiliogogogochensis]
MRGIQTGLALVCAWWMGGEGVAWAQQARRTLHPVVFAHGLSGYDDLLGFDYFGDELGNFVGDACDELLELSCNPYLDSGQRAFGAQVQAFQSSEVRGLDLASDIEGVLATTGATRVNIVGHSQGGIDARKAAKVLFERQGRAVVDVIVSVSSPHRGSPVAKYVLDLGPGVTSVASALANIFGDIIYKPGNDGIAAVKQLIYNDADATDGIVTGMKAFNAANPMDARYASHYASLLTAQAGLEVNPAFFLVRLAFYDIDGDGFCVDDCDNDGAAGQGDGVRNERDDDGVVGINSQQMGPRLRYTDAPLGLDTITVDGSLGPVTDLNAPGSAQMTSLSSVLDQDHLDVVGFGPDLFDELGFYAAIIHYISQNE